MTNRATATIHGWLLLLPAMACLALFTHWPAVASFVESFYSTPKARRPARFVGLDNYQQMLADPIFWKALTNNLWFALGNWSRATSACGKSATYFFIASVS